MANYVYNYLYCNKDAKDKLLSLDYEYAYMISAIGTENVFSIDDRYVILFNTRGMEYRTDFIEAFIMTE